MQINIQPATATRLERANLAGVEFGKLISDHMLVADYESGAWANARIVPYGPMTWWPAMMTLHYGQAVFEGMKVFRREDGRIAIFRPDAHLERFNRSLRRMCMPEIPTELFHDGIEQLVRLDNRWVPAYPGSLYIRPFAFATEARLKIKLADQFQFIILTSPAGPYQARPYRLKVETEFTRTVEGGTGFVKCAGNYGSSYYPMQMALQEGYDQVIWTDGKEHRYIDEAGMMNIMFVINGRLITPVLSTAILSGITRDSILTLARNMGIEVEERRIAVEEIRQDFLAGQITEAFGTGTAAVIAQIATICIGAQDFNLPSPGPDSLQTVLKDRLEQIRLGNLPDEFGWLRVL